MARGSIVFEGWRLRFESPAMTLEIPLTRLQIELGESPWGNIHFRDPQAPDWSIQTFDTEILDHRSLLQQSHTRNQIRQFQSYAELKRRLKITLWFFAGFALTAAMVSLLLGLMVRSLVARIPPEWEQELGDTLIQELKQEETFVEDAKLKAKLDRAVTPLVAALPRSKIQYNFYILQDPVPNALAVPGGHVLVNTGLLDLAERPEEIAGAVAHEIAHVTQKHGFREIISSAGPFLICSVFLGGGGGLQGVLGDSADLLLRQSYSQKFELEADDVGWQYLVAARIDPRGMTDLLKKLEIEEHKQTGAEVEIAALSSHPATEKRIRRLEMKWRKLKDKSGFVALDHQAGK